MKYVVLSFDDGLIDFKNNALPILIKYGLKATINVISGYSDLSVSTDYGYLSVDDIKILNKSGFEIANHTNSHIKYGSYEELEQCNKKINKWCETDTVLGIAMPKYAKPSESANQFIEAFNPPYVTYESQKVVSLNNIFRRLIWKLKSTLKKNDLNISSYAIQRKVYKKGHATFFRRIEVGKDTDPILLYDSLKTIRDNWCITLCFHSVTNNVDETPYPKGSCTILQFEKICKLIGSNSQFAVVTQIDACKR